MNEGDRVILIRPNLWAGYRGVVKSVGKQKTEHYGCSEKMMTCIVRCEQGFDAVAAEDEIQKISLKQSGR
jgi:hypothetical protein